jgi:Tol biopolymer transport system component
VQLTDRAGLNWNPTWSPDGRFLYFSSDRDGAGNLWRIPIDERSGKATGSPEPVTTGGGSTLRQHAAISADGARIAYVEQTVTENLVKVPFDSVSRKITGPPVPLTRGSRRVHSPHPSADGTMLAFQSYGVREDIYVIRSDGTGERQLTNDEFRDRIPRWSPDGRTIAFYSNRGGSFDIWTIEADGSNLRQITKDGAADVRAVWSPDGKQLAGYRFNQSGFLLDFTSSPPRETPITGFANSDSHFLPWSWSLDGTWLAGENYSTASGQITGLFLYSLADRSYQALTDFGISPTWLSDSQRLMVLTGGKLVIVSRTGKREEISALPAEEIFQFAVDSRFVYLITRTQESDVWLMTHSDDER